MKNKHKKMSPDAVSLVAARFKVLSEPLRLHILQYLENGESSVGSITKGGKFNTAERQQTS
ncbi:MAG: hypothetical protein IPG67_17150 [Acidobacteria bacterium]|nr:hypothetical protein [Acidobacteriota bacterium]